MQCPNLARWCVLSLTLVLLSSCASSNQTQKPGAQFDEEAARAAKKVDDRAERLAALLPAETQILLQARADEFEADLARMPGKFARLVERLEEVGSALGHLDRSRPALVAIATTGSQDYIERAWLNVPVTHREGLPEGLHVRLLLPASDPAKLEAELGDHCDGQGSGGEICRRLTLVRPTEAHVTIDYLTSADEDVQALFLERLGAQKDAPNARLLERRTPALHRFLRADAPLSLYSKPEGLWNTSLVHYTAQGRAALTHASPEKYMAMLLRVDGLGFGRLLGDPQAAEFEDIALLIDLFQPEGGELTSPPAQLRVDAIRTYTEYGRELWVKERMASAELRPTIESPLFEFSWHAPVDRLLAKARAPAWTGGRALPVKEWFEEIANLQSPGQFTHLIPLLQHPAGVLHAASRNEVAAQFQPGLAGILGVDPKLMPTLAEALGIRSFSMTAGVNSGGRIRGIMDFRFALLIEWRERVFGASEEIDTALQRIAKQGQRRDGRPVAGFELANTADGGQRLVVTLNTSFEPVEQAEPESGTIWKAHLDGARVPAQAAGMVEILGPMGDHLHAASIGRQTHEITRLQFGGRSFEAHEELVGFDADSFETIEPADGWRGCMGAARLALEQSLQALESATPENRPKMLQYAIDASMADAEACEEAFPNEAERFRWVRGGWYNWQGAWAAHAYDYVGAGPKFSEACALGYYEPACAESERLEALPDFRMPPYESHYYPRLSQSDVETYLMTDRGLFDGKEVAVEARELRDAPREATNGLASLLGDENLDFAQIAADAMTDADLVARVAHGLQKHEIGTKLVVNVSRELPKANVLNVNDPDGAVESLYRVHIGKAGIEVYDGDQMLEPIEGCAADGPTICLDDTKGDAAELLASTQEAWQADESDRAFELFDQAMAAYRLHELYNVLYKLGQKTPDQRSLKLSAAEGLPVSALIRVTSLVIYEREQARYETIQALRESRPQRRGPRLLELFSSPVLVPN